MTFIDECHATGFFGDSGRGTEEFFGMTGKIDIINSTLGKALGGAAGGYTTASRQIVDLLRQRARPYLFSNSIPPPVVSCASQVFSMLMKDSSFVAKIKENTTRFRSKMTEAGFTISGEDHPICPVMLGDAKLASDMADDMLSTYWMCYNSTPFSMSTQVASRPIRNFVPPTLMSAGELKSSRTSNSLRCHKGSPKKLCLVSCRTWYICHRIQLSRGTQGKGSNSRSAFCCSHHGRYW